MAGAVTLQSNQIFRGESFSGDDPGLTLAATYDDPSGFFFGADASLAAGGERPRFTASNQYIGYALRAGEASFEAGYVHRTYDRMFDTAYRRNYSELFAGVSYRTARLRAYVSPDYRVDGRSSYYLEADARILTYRAWNLSAHGGISILPQDLSEPSPGYDHYQDWNVTASRRWRGFDLGVGIARTNYPVFGASRKARAFATVTRMF